GHLGVGEWDLPRVGDRGDARQGLLPRIVPIDERYAAALVDELLPRPTERRAEWGEAIVGDDSDLTVHGRLPRPDFTESLRHVHPAARARLPRTDCTESRRQIIPGPGAPGLPSPARMSCASRGTLSSLGSGARGPPPRFPAGHAECRGRGGSERRGDAWRA